ncbi:MAG: transcription-repair coupling factor [Firmicutes bacterium]|nr:transcription-repair coupling factor [Bacillota bacterium]
MSETVKLDTGAILDICRGSDSYGDLLQALRQRRCAEFSGAAEGLKAAWLAALFLDLRQPMLLITPGEEEGARLAENIRPYLGDACMFFPAMELLPFQVFGRNIELSAARIRALSRLCQGETLLAVASVNSLCRNIAPPQVFSGAHLRLRAGDVRPMDALAETLIQMGYERQTLTEIPGAFSRRGSVMDIFPFTAADPVRLEFFDDELESLRTFDPADQLSKQDLGEILLTPGRETPINGQVKDRALQMLEAEYQKNISSYHGEEKMRFTEFCGQLREFLQEDVWDNSLEMLTPYFYGRPACLLDYMGRGPVVLDEADQILEEAVQQDKERHERYSDMLQEGRLLPSFFDNYLSFSGLSDRLHQGPLLRIGQLPPHETGPEAVCRREISSRDIPLYAASPQLFAGDMRRFRGSGWQVFISATSDIRRKREEELLREYDLPPVTLLDAAFTKGFESSDLALALVTEKDLFAREGKTRPRRRYKEGEKIGNFLDLRPGDYVVHAHQGIGQYVGVERLSVGHVARDYLLIRYAGQDKLYVPVDQLDLIQKYIGNDGVQPKIYRLGGDHWQKAKARARKSVRDMAQELLTLYAQRERGEGYAFSPDTPWQQEFEDAFPFEETPDQLQSLAEIKADMESRKIMDRLLCGDVGYGKTEVALRAAFKGVMDGKQVAFLTPSTVLTQQHLRTIEERFAGYPIKIAGLSRFYSAKEQKRILEGLAAGAIDIVVGTHRLLSKDVTFKDLGLLIVDEEQRFGVAHKERIKEWKASIDVLTLSATPIPRTLHMSLVGLRDMSIINTPPQDRRPVQTYVVEYHQKLIRDAIARELARGGQVYYVHNRVASIYDVAAELQVQLPQARIAVAHGQMNERELAEVMFRFDQGEADILLCTTIIENGLDIANVNTLIVDQADMYGLSQLYQLRGRVGRSSRQAFAYFTYRKDKKISDTAKKRLIAIRDFTELGAGFKIAMRDLELRGAGNLLGAEQHGHILALGFDMYCKLLQEEVAKAEGAPEEPQSIATMLELQLDAYIPDDYIAADDLKVEIYKKIAAAQEVAEVDKLAGQLADRYGALPDQLKNLLLLGKIKAPARLLSIVSIMQKDTGIEIKFADNHPLNGEDLLALLDKWPRRLSFSEKKGFALWIKTAGIDQPLPRAELALAVLQELARLVSARK